MSRPLGLSLLLLGACAPATGPTADAGFNVHGAPGQIFAFDASSSAGDALRFSWVVHEAPVEATYTLEDATSASALLIPETEGVYVLGVEVCDRRGACDHAETEAWVGETAARAGLGGFGAVSFGGAKPKIMGKNRPPEAVGTASKGLVSSSTVKLSASGSSDPDGDTLRYRWRLYAVPANSNLTDADISDATDVTAAFTADIGGTYKVTLTVRDGVAADSVLLPDLVLRGLEDAEPIPWLRSP
jgi:hypothetical protein